MNLLFRPDEGCELRVYSRSGSWFAILTTTTDITCGHGVDHRIQVEYQREFTAEDEGVLLDAFEATLKALVADTQEQRMRVLNGVRQLASSLTDECVYSTFVDPCVMSES